MVPAQQDDARHTDTVDASARATAQSELVGTLIDGRFEPVEVLGRGGAGAVYRAHDRQLEVEVALKVLSPGSGLGSAERVRREVLAARQVVHPNVVRIFEVGFRGQHRYLAMELMDGGSLEDLLRSRGPLPPDECRGIILEVARGVAALHACGIVHRDLKPGNILLDREGRLKVGDLGLVRRDDVAGLTSENLVVGTPEYLAPEQAQGRPVTPASDVYALGVIFFQLLTGRRPFAGGPPIEVAMRHVRDAPPLGEIRDRSARRLVAKLMAKDPGRRPATAAEVVELLEAGGDGPVRAPGDPGDAPIRRWRWWSAAIATVGLAVLAAAMAWRWQATAGPAGEGGGRPAAGVDYSIRETTIVAVDPAGSEVARYDAEQKVYGFMVADVDRAGGEEVLVGFCPGPRSLEPQSLLVLSSDLELLAEVPPSELVRGINGLGKTYCVRPLGLRDIRGDGSEDLLLAYVHQPSYPLLIHVLDLPSFNPVVEYSNSGAMSDLAWADVDGREGEELILLVMNNRLGHLFFVGVFPTKPNQTQGMNPEGDLGLFSSPDLTENPMRMPLWYTAIPLEMAVGMSARLEIDRGRQRIEVWTRDGVVTWFDFQGRREGRPGTAGRPDDYTRLARAGSWLEAGEVERALQELDALAADHGDEVFEISMQRLRWETLLRSGRAGQAAREALAIAERGSMYESFRLRAAEALFLAGEVDAALDQVRALRALITPVTTDAHFLQVEFLWLAGAGRSELEGVVMAPVMGTPRRFESWDTTCLLGWIALLSGEPEETLRLIEGCWTEGCPGAPREVIDRIELLARIDLEPDGPLTSELLADLVQRCRPEERLELEGWYLHRNGDSEGGSARLLRAWRQVQARASWSFQDRKRLPMLGQRTVEALEAAGMADQARQVRRTIDALHPRPFGVDESGAASHR